MFGTQLPASGIGIMDSDGDADLNFVSRALAVAKTCSLSLLAKDTNLLILLLYYYNLLFHHPVYLYSDSSKTTVDIKQSKELIDDGLTQAILQYMPFEPVISHQGCILFDHVQYYKIF